MALHSPDMIFRRPLPAKYVFFRTEIDAKINVWIDQNQNESQEAVPPDLGALSSLVKGLAICVNIKKLNNASNTSAKISLL